MTYTIAEASKRTGLSAHTLRFYDKEGLMPYVDRDPAGNRVFKESDFGWLTTISCLKESGMPIKQIRKYIEWGMQGDDTIGIRLDVMREHKKEVEEKMEELKRCMERIDQKIWFYEKAQEIGHDEAMDLYERKFKSI